MVGGKVSVAKWNKSLFFYFYRPQKWESNHESTVDQGWIRKKMCVSDNDCGVVWSNRFQFDGFEP